MPGHLQLTLLNYHAADPIELPCQATKPREAARDPGQKASLPTRFGTAHRVGSGVEFGLGDRQVLGAVPAMAARERFAPTHL